MHIACLIGKVTGGAVQYAYAKLKLLTSACTGSSCSLYCSYTVVLRLATGRVPAEAYAIAGQEDGSLGNIVDGYAGVPR